MSEIAGPELVDHNALGRQYAVASTHAALAALAARLGARAVHVLPGVDVPFHSALLAARRGRGVDGRGRGHEPVAERAGQRGHRSGRRDHGRGTLRDDAVGRSRASESAARASITDAGNGRGWTP